MSIHICLKGSWNKELKKSQLQIDQLRVQFQTYKDKEAERNQLFKERSEENIEEKKEHIEDNEENKYDRNSKFWSNVAINLENFEQSKKEDKDSLPFTIKQIQGKI